MKNMDGPSYQIEERKDTLTLKDMHIIRAFISKGIREKIFDVNELFTLHIILEKVDNIIKIASEKSTDKSTDKSIDSGK